MPNVLCPDCTGTGITREGGSAYGDRSCPLCNGSGEVHALTFTASHYTPESSQIEVIEHDPFASVMRVWFKQGGTYDYSEVPSELFDQAMKAPSIGKWLQSEIKSAKKPYVKVADPGPKPEKPAPKIDTTYDSMSSEEYLAKIAEANRQ